MSEHSVLPNGGAAPYLGDASNMRRISNSEVSTWLTCQRKYYYEFDLNLQPRRQGKALGRGVLLHDVLALYYERLKAGCTHSVAVTDARARLQTYLADDAFGMDTVAEVDNLLRGYWDYYQGDPDWEILEVEKGYDLALTEDYEYALRLDLLVKSRSTGQTILVDHKTAYDFWTEDDLDLNPQFPKYIGSLRANGVFVDKAILNQIRTRKLKNPTGEDLFRRTVCKPSIAKVQNAIREQVLSSREIVKHRALPVEVRASNSKRVLNKMICRNCDVKALCMSEYDGGDITHMIDTDYTQRTYGYNEPTEEM